MAKWKSLGRHVTNIHDGHSEIFPNCVHDPIESHTKTWIENRSLPHRELEKIILSTPLCRDIAKISPTIEMQTSSLESFHKVVIWFAPKSVHFFYKAMRARILIAALHFNENVKRQHAMTNNGEERWAVSYPRSQMGAAIVKPVKVAVTYNYVQKLLDETIKMRMEYPSYTSVKKLSNNEIIPPPVCASYAIVDKVQLVRNHTSRFCQNEE